MKVELHVISLKGGENVPTVQVEPGTEGASGFVQHLLIDGEEIFFGVVELGKSHVNINADGFLEIEVKGIDERSWNRFFKAKQRTPADVLDGTGVKVMDGDEVVGLAWEEGCSLIVAVTEIVTVGVPVQAMDRSAA